MDDEKLLNRNQKRLLEIPIFGRGGLIGVCRAAWENETRITDQSLIIDIIEESGPALEAIYKRAESNRQMTKKVQLENDLLINKFTRIGEISATIAHELRNPMTTISTYLQMLALDHRIDAKDLDLMMEELGRANRLLGDFLNLARNDGLHLEKWDINDLVERCLELCQGQFKYHRIKLEKSLESYINTDVLIDADKIKQAIMNICNNALEAMEPGGTLRVSSLFEGNRGKIRFVDEGPGISPEHLASIREPFFTTKALGTGLGIPVSYKIIEDHKGELHFESEQGKGTTVTIILPLISWEE